MKEWLESCGKRDGVTSGLNYEKENVIYSKGNSGVSII
jgi:hypothetical protein